MKSIEIDTTVYEALIRSIRSFEDNPNTVLRRILKLDAERDERSDAKREQMVDSTQSDVPREQSLAHARKVDGRARSRARSGEILAMDAYYLPILQALDQLGGQASSRRVLGIVETLMGESLKGKDLQKQESGEIRWRYRAQMSRLGLVKDGLLDSAAPRGTWKLTDEGRRAVSSERSQKEVKDGLS